MPGNDPNPTFPERLHVQPRIGETMIDSGIRETSDGMGEPLSPLILGELEAGLIALSEFIDDELGWLEGRCQEARAGAP